MIRLLAEEVLARGSIPSRRVVADPTVTDIQTIYDGIPQRGAALHYSAAHAPEYREAAKEENGNGTGLYDAFVSAPSFFAGACGANLACLRVQKFARGCFGVILAASSHVWFQCAL
jgi:hypothetical protein